MFTRETYKNRRGKLKSLVSNGIGLFLGNQEMPMNYPGNTYRYRQDSSFLYFFGINHPGFAAVIDFDSGKEIIFGTDFDIDDIIWMGPQPSVKELASNVGVESVNAFSVLSDFLKSEIGKGRKIHFLPPYRADNKILLAEATGIPVSQIKASASIELIKAVVELRSVKEIAEINHIDSIMDVAYEMHTTAMKMAKGGVYEREIHGAIEGIALSYGGTVSFPVILSKRGETLHNHYHGNLLSDGDLVLVDAGFESEYGYATDHTRTVPVGGKYSSRQKDIYEIVLKAKDNATEIVKPGAMYLDAHMKAALTIAQGLTALGLMKGNPEDAVAAGAHTLFFPHGLGHMMGLDVHDMEDLGENFVGYDAEIERSKEFGTAYLRLAKRLKPGYVMTNEPGIYFIPALIDKWIAEGIGKDFVNFNKVNEYRDFGGIRLEDDLLVTDSGARNLGKQQIPIRVNEVESIAGKGR